VERIFLAVNLAHDLRSGSELRASHLCKRKIAYLVYADSVSLTRLFLTKAKQPIARALAKGKLRSRTIEAVNGLIS
jgi:hypothetical protein